MNRTDDPKKQPVPFGVNGPREDIGPTTPTGDNSASYNSGFPPITMLLKAAGGLPPKGQDMNQILYELSSLSRWNSAGALNVYDSTFGAAISGYPKGAVLSNSTFTGSWLNTTDGNTANPENTNASLTGWVPAFTYGTTDVTGLAAANVTLTALQAANERITLAGMLTANINLIFPAWSKSWTIVNNCTGAFSVTCKTPSGTGIAVAAGSTVRIIGNGTNIISNESPLITGALQKSANLSDLANVQTALANLTLTDMGIGLPSMTVIANFDWQNFVFTSGANYLTAYNTWINPPAGITYNAGDNISVRVEYVYGNRIGLRLTPDTGAAANFKVYELLCVGAAGSRVFTFNQDWNSAIPVPITGGGTGGKTAAEALTNLGLGEGSLVPIGIPLPYPLATPPTGFLKVNGSSFSAATYPKLALAYPSGVLPDLRGEFIRGFDDGRGVRADQNLLGWQGGGIQSHNHGLSNFEIRGLTGGPTPGWFTSVNGLSTGDSGGDETRPRNIAFNYIVRAI